jgi:hypothetical protein
MAQDSERTGLRSAWFDVIADAAFDDIRDDARLAELRARFRL